jgi:hypothetical protein
MTPQERVKAEQEQAQIEAILSFEIVDMYKGRQYTAVFTRLFSDGACTSDYPLTESEYKRLKSYLADADKAVTHDFGQSYRLKMNIADAMLARCKGAICAGGDVN